MPPVVGITCSITKASWGSRGNEGAALLPEPYVRAVQRAGAVPLVLPASAPSAAEGVLRRLDGLVLAGGDDVDPARYGAERHGATTPAGEERELWELALLDAALGGDLPTLTICRGAQVLNVALGGDLVQHLPDVLGHDEHLPGAGSYGPQALSIDGASTTGRVLGEQVEARCHHHQGLGRLGADLRAVAWARDGIVEGVEMDGHRFMVAAQWHPERSGHDGLFEALTAAIHLETAIP